MQRTIPRAAWPSRFLILTPAQVNLALIALAAAVLGTEGLLRQPLLSEMSISSVVLAEYLLLAVFAIPVAFVYRRQLTALALRDWAVLLAIGGGASAGAALLFTKALASGSPTTASLLQNMQPLIVVVLAMAMLKERISAFYWPCLAAAMLGAYLLSFGMLDPRSMLAVDDAATAGYALGAAALWGTGTVLGRIALTRLSYVTLTAVRILLAIPFAAAFAMSDGGPAASIEGIVDTPVRLTVTALGPGLAAVLLFYRGLSGTRASHATLAEFMYPVTALVGNWLILDIMIALPQMLGMLIILLTLVLLAWLPSPPMVAELDAPGIRAQSGERRTRRESIGIPIRRLFCTKSASG